jgi:dipeptidase E
LSAAKRILAIGGGGFLMEDAPSPIDRFIVELTGQARPRICYIGTANGDMPDGIEKFYAAYPAQRCEPSHLAFFRKPMPGSLPLAGYEPHLAAQDAIFVAGGNTRSALGVWREWGLDQALARAYEAGTLLCGMSAGALCWFEAGLTDSFWGAGDQPLRCLGLLPGGCAVHYGAAAQRRERLHAAVQSGALPATIAIDDGSAALYEDGALARVVRWGSGRGAFAVSALQGRAVEVAHPSTSIDELRAQP